MGDLRVKVKISLYLRIFLRNIVRPDILLDKMYNKKSVSNYGRTDGQKNGQEGRMDGRMNRAKTVYPPLLRGRDINLFINTIWMFHRPSNEPCKFPSLTHSHTVTPFDVPGKQAF